MLSFDEVGLMLDDIAKELPDDFYKELNGGIILVPDSKLHEESHESCNLYILGEYHRDKYMGRYINMYYGSFIKVYAHLEPEQLKEELKRILLHEFTHHLESLAGERGLEVKDIQDIEKYKQKFK